MRFNNEQRYKPVLYLMRRQHATNYHMSEDKIVSLCGHRLKLMVSSDDKLIVVTSGWRYHDLMCHNCLAARERLIANAPIQGLL